MNNFNKQIEWVNNGRQIGYYLINNDKLVECAVQKFNNLILLYHLEWNMKLDFDEYAEEKYLVFKDISLAIEYIKSLNLYFDEFSPQKGCKMFNPNDSNFQV